jgi:hypothetical protein
MFTAQCFKDPEAPAAALLVSLVRTYGTAAFQWEPELVRQQIKEDYGVAMTALNSDKLQAAIHVLTDHQFESDWLVFQNICHQFSNVPDSFEDFEPLDPEEIIFGLAQAILLLNGPIQFHDTIRAYVGQIFFNHGFSSPPTMFPSAIMPVCPPSDDSEKNKTLEELFHFHLNRTTDYLDQLS